MQPKPNRPYELQEYDPAWPQRFVAAAETLKPLFGSNLVELDHIGSTSVIGMVAKPQIDVLAVVKDLDEVTAHQDVFREAGLKIHGRCFVAEDDEYMTIDSPDGRRLVSVHTLQAGNPKIQDYKDFRDYLQSHEDERSLYIATKRNLYALHADNVQSYYNGKRDTIKAIIARAQVWASEKRG